MMNKQSPDGGYSTIDCVHISHQPAFDLPFIGTMSRSSRTLYVGNIPGDIHEREVEDLFYKYGQIAHIDLKIPPRPPSYAFFYSFLSSYSSRRLLMLKMLFVVVMSTISMDTD
ncbi:hypothetical protein OSB04_024433 [Centaurea solstitialis]|uniref:RRM domain-containing protein n=1 Tax=Centaurea solstitialis TaxID=347529 RepID=A0AA38SZG6_9ASTR|nr:hypothetical protein OSB04_024433 [Centaurea solstitialis]